MELPDVMHKETGDDGIANLTLQLCFQAIRYLDADTADKRKAKEVDNMFAGLITTDKEPTYKKETANESAEATHD
jgi:hypothetical protein